jgi:hypothetical protein
MRIAPLPGTGLAEAPDSFIGSIATGVGVPHGRAKRSADCTRRRTRKPARYAPAYAGSGPRLLPGTGLAEAPDSFTGSLATG